MKKFVISFSINLKIKIITTFVLLFFTFNNLYAEVYYFDKSQLSVDSLENFMSSEAKVSKDIRIDILSILLTYKNYCVGLETRNDKIYVIMKNGRRLIYDDKTKKTFEQKLDNSDIKNMLDQIYKTGPVLEETKADYDPGRFRVGEFFDIIYGDTYEKVKSNCEVVKFCNRNILFNKNNGASTALKRVWHYLNRQGKENPKIYDYICPTAGTLASRKIAGTQRKSPHSYAIAIDLNTNKSLYWRWSKKKQVINSIRQYPISIITIFEDNGFIWGGKWDHYDTMHFEYRPELITRQKLINKY